MANYNECKACRNAQKNKHKFDVVWKFVAVISTILAIVFMCLYFANGTIYETMEISNEIELENEGGTQNNENIGNVNYASDNNGVSTFIIICIIVGIFVTGGVIIYGCHAVQKGRYKKQSEGYQKFKPGEQVTNGKDKAKN